MKKLAALGLSVLPLASPAVAQDWDSYFNMGTFAAGGGSDANGWLSLECADPDSGFSSAGRPFLSVTVMSGISLNKKSLADGLAFWVDDGQSYVLPMSLEEGSSTILHYDHSDDSVGEVLDLIEALRKGGNVGLEMGAEFVMRVTLEGSFQALEYVEACIRDAQ